MSKVQTMDGRVHEIPSDLIDECSTLQMICEMTDCTDETWVPLPNVDSAILETIVRFFESGSLPEFTDPRTLTPLLNAADYLGYDNLIDAGSKAVAESLKGRDPKEIRDIVGLEEPDA